MKHQNIPQFVMILFSLFFALPAISQYISINEVVSSNTILRDADGDTPDWFELYNSGTSTVDLTGWSITDNEN